MCKPSDFQEHGLHVSASFLFWFFLSSLFVWITGADEEEEEEELRLPSLSLSLSEDDEELEKTVNTIHYWNTQGKNFNDKQATTDSTLLSFTDWPMEIYSALFYQVKITGYSKWSYMYM